MTQPHRYYPALPSSAHHHISPSPPLFAAPSQPPLLPFRPLHPQPSSLLPTLPHTPFTSLFTPFSQSLPAAPTTLLLFLSLNSLLCHLQPGHPPSSQPAAAPPLPNPPPRTTSLSTLCPQSPSLPSPAAISLNLHHTSASLSTAAISCSHHLRTSASLITIRIPPLH
ncbi:hypothetical protein AMTR_s00003p00259820 [Amborella trichopoda]|uniref:Uncharacterized protein n=1 Tax=Amborella trichopoda TaxID=13333 RepID=W1P672_AMBTC|nr:hypothetical protein AMTR_s00003p00259820 [Amborella trichopoda]